jgi:hypothetical protein
MNKQFLIFLGLAVLLGFIFYQANNKPVTEDSSDNETAMSEEVELIGDAMDKENEEDDAMMKEEGEAMEEKMELPDVKLADQRFQLYSNNAVGYTIDQPTNWFWQHFHLARLTEVHPSITDIYASSRTALPSLENIYDSTIIIEVSSNDLSNTVSNLTSTSVKINDKDTTRYEGQRDGKNVIEYHLKVGSTNVRFIYSNKDKNNSEVAIFDHLVNSFSF